MNLCVDLQIATEDDDHPPPSQIEQWVAAAINHHAQLPSIDQAFKDAAELTVRIVDTAEITQLNSDYRNKNQPTNVLSFAAELPEHIQLPLLGDLVICAAIVRKEAREQNKTLQAHWAHMVIHGSLHLLGYDHIDDGDADIMEALEVNILASLNIANPYTIKNASNAANQQEECTQNHVR